MATRLANLQLALDHVCKQIKDITELPKPDTSIDGEGTQWSGHLVNLLQQEATLRQAIQREGGAFEVRSRGI
jgi:hypothetical protein